MHLQLIDDKSVASCQQTCCKLIVQTCYPRAFCKLFKQVITILQVTSCSKPDFNEICNLMKSSFSCLFQEPVSTFSVMLELAENEKRFGFSVVGGVDEGFRPRIDDIVEGIADCSKRFSVHL